MKPLRLLPIPSLAAALLLLSGNIAAAQQNAARAALPPPSSAKAPHAPTSRIEIPVLPPLAKLSATRERPLFVKSRRPPSVVVKPVEHHEPPKVVASDELPAELVGIVMGPDQTYAILKNHDSQQFEHVHRGEKVEDWALDDIAPRYILLHRGNSKMRVELFDEKKEEEAERQKTGNVAQRGPRRAFRPPPQVMNTPRRITTPRRLGPQRARVRRPIPRRPQED